MISSHVEASKIGRQIAEQVMDTQRKSGDCTSPDSTPSPPCKESLPAEVSQIKSKSSVKKAPKEQGTKAFEEYTVY